MDSLSKDNMVICGLVWKYRSLLYSFNIMFRFCAGCFDRSPTSVPPRANEVNTPSPRRVRTDLVANSSNRSGWRRNKDVVRQTVHLKTEIPRIIIHRQHDDTAVPVVTPYERLSCDGRDSKPSSSTIEFSCSSPFPAEGVSSERFPYLYNNAGNDNVMVSSRLFPYLYDAIAAYHSHGRKEGYQVVAIPNSSTLSRAFPYLYSERALDDNTGTVSAAAFPYVYDGDTPITEAKRNRNRRSFGSKIRIAPQR